MTRDDIIRMAREAKLSNEIGAFGYPYLPELERFAALIAAAEREACAKVCEAQRNAVVVRHPARIEFDPDNVMAEKCAAMIRARGEK